MAATITVRRARGEDARAATELARRAKAHWGYPSEWLDQWRDELVITSAYLEQHHGFVAVDGAAIVGVAVVEIDGTAATLEHVWIAPEAQRQGIGRLLVTAALEFAAMHHVTRVEVISDPFAEAFYQRLGAERCGTVPAPMPGAPDRVLPRLAFQLPL